MLKIKLLAATETFTYKKHDGRKKVLSLYCCQVNSCWIKHIHTHTHTHTHSEPYLHRQQPGQVDLRDGFGHRLVLHAASLRLHLIDLVCGSHQVERVVVLQQRVFWVVQSDFMVIYFAWESNQAHNMFDTWHLKNRGQFLNDLSENNLQIHHVRKV